MEKYQTKIQITSNHSQYFPHYLKKKNLLEYSCFTTLYSFLLYGKVNQLHSHIYPLFFGFPSHLGQHHHYLLHKYILKYYPILFNSKLSLKLLTIKARADIKNLNFFNQVIWFLVFLTDWLLPALLVGRLWRRQKSPLITEARYPTSEKAMAPHSSTLSWKILWMEEPGRLQTMGSRRVGHNWATSLSLFTFMHWRRKWQPTPVFLSGESQGWGSLVGCRL